MGHVFDFSEVEDLIGNLNGEGEEERERRKKFSNEIGKMFPDVEPSFLFLRCLRLRNQEDYATFINNVMLKGIYPKKSGVWNDVRSTTPFPQDNEIHFLDLDHFHFKPVFYSCDEESSNSDVMESGYCNGKREESRRGGSFQVDPGPSTSTTSINDFPGEPETKNLMELRKREESIGAVGGSLQTHDPNSKWEEGQEENIQCIDYSHADHYSKRNISCNPDGDGHCWKGCPETLKSRNAEAMQSERRVGEEVASESTEACAKYPDPESGGNAREGDLNTWDEWVVEKTADLIRLFPDTDPTFLRDECVKFEGSLEAMNDFVISKLEKKDMPSRAEYEKRQQMQELQNIYTKNFSIEDFLKVIPDPWTYFINSQRDCAKYKAHSTFFLRHSFRNIHTRDITTALINNNFNLYLSYKELKEKASGGRSLSYECESKLARPTHTYIQFLQEVAFIENEEKIRDFIKARDVAKEYRVEEAKRSGMPAIECKCCYEADIMVEDMVYCPNDHPFCKPCLTKYVEMKIGAASYDFPCLAGCRETFTLFTLQKVVKSEVFSKIVQAKQMEEIEAARIEGLVQCPFCSYAVIMPPEDKVLSCLNPKCQKKTCRLCKEPCHIPLRCDEVEKSEEVKKRTYVENKMTQALIRTCYKCGKGFVKEDGCNKIECQCGAKMCYVCRKPITSYSHFRNSKLIDCKKCPLYSTNEELHVKLVKKAEEEAKAELLGKPCKRVKGSAKAVPSHRTKIPRQWMT